MRVLASLLIALFLSGGPAVAATIFIEAESFDEHGGWKLDTQFIELMGSPYLLAHGLGEPVDDARTTVEVPEAGTYRVWVRTKDWVARWNAPGAPGRFQLLIDDEPLGETFGTEGAEWHWQAGGAVDIEGPTATLALHDLTGFDGRCDAIFLSSDEHFIPPDDSSPVASWRRRWLNLPEEPKPAGAFDLVVIGGGYAGMGASISAARAGCRVALIQDRGVLGGNGSSEIRVWAKGVTRRGRYPHLGEITEEFADRASASPGEAEEYGDERKERIIRAEPNITLLLHHHACAVELDGDGAILAVRAFDTRTGGEKRFTAPLFADCTGHGTIGHLAGADCDMTGHGHMGMSNMWRWTNTTGAAAFPKTPWALPLTMRDFPYPRNGEGKWFWESGFDRHPIRDLEYVRDWNLRAVYGAFNAMKNGDGAMSHLHAKLTWVAYIAGPRESRRLLGDVILSSGDVVGARGFVDGCVSSTWPIDLHYPDEEYIGDFGADPFISKAVYDRRIDPDDGYAIPYRCFYSRNVPNLFMAGRCISVTHEALGTVRVMRTCGMMGEVVGKAAALCIRENCRPRQVYQSHFADLVDLLHLPGELRMEMPGR
jgi:hypothetical protein